MKVLMIYISATDTWGDLPLHEVLVRKLNHAGVAGATVLKGTMGYGAHHKVHRDRLFGVSDDRPMMILATDEEDRLRAAMAGLRALPFTGPAFLLDATPLP